MSASPTSCAVYSSVKRTTKCSLADHDVVTLAELLHEAGYATMMSGKWHLGYMRGFIPCDRGFQKSLSMLVGAHNHFGWNPDWRAAGLGKPPKPTGGSEPIYVKDDKRWLPWVPLSHTYGPSFPDTNLYSEPNTTEDPAGYYSSNFFADTMISFLKDSAEDRTKNDRPFFAYLPFSAPHTPIQCFKEDRDVYRGKYDDGPTALRRERLAALAEKGIIEDAAVPHPVLVRGVKWENMTETQRKHSSRQYESYAGMVEALDRATGRVIDHLRSTDELDNTIVMVFSDNGPASGTLGTQPDPGERLPSAADVDER